ncbi:hypothetical protein SAMN05661010_02555 [Modicisalibacter muralis]|uniref:Uncharacterized protein n=1 Tax=Modicisalibacter muralis TaxID=119000 RepID=A0A1G9MX43_9GAMM|nr:hypothetical protein [Halomonas muralis]SDL78779.1 hypothetical protein SAMN05661010_02555 [Halomonas muralis]
MKRANVVPISAVFDAPQFAREFITLAQRTGRCRSLHIRRPVEVDVVVRGKPKKKTEWQEY